MRCVFRYSMSTQLPTYSIGVIGNILGSLRVMRGASSWWEPSNPGPTDESFTVYWCCTGKSSLAVFRWRIRHQYRFWIDIRFFVRIILVEFMEIITIRAFRNVIWTVINQFEVYLICWTCTLFSVWCFCAVWATNSPYATYSGSIWPLLYLSTKD